MKTVKSEEQDKHDMRSMSIVLHIQRKGLFKFAYNDLKNPHKNHRKAKKAQK